MKHIVDHFSRDISIVSGNGCRVTDAHGKTYLDFIAGWCVGNIGWNHHEVLAALRRQADSGVYVPAIFRTPAWERFGQRLTSIMPQADLKKAFRCTSGSEAVELAIKAARAATGRKTIISLSGLYHGHTYGAASVGRALTEAMGPGVPGMIHLPMPDPYRGVTADDVLSRLEKTFRVNQDVAAFFCEPVFSGAGAVVPSPDFYPQVERLCRQNGALFIMDEVATGFGRCGALFASSLWGLKPDIVCLGKGLTSGYGTMGATVVTEAIAEAARNIPYYSTFGWNPYDLAAAEAVADYIVRERLWQNAHHIGSYLQQQWRDLETRPFIGQVRGAGLMIGIDIVKDKQSKEPDPKRAEQIVDVCADKGLLVDLTDWGTSVIFISPPLTLTQAEAEEGAKILEEAMS